MAPELFLTYNAIVENDGEITLPEELLRDLGWAVGDDLALENTDAELIVRRLKSDEQKA